MAIYNFQEVNSIMMQDPLYHLAKILPGWTLDGDEYCCSNIEGCSGKSLKFNIIKGVWSDFATGEGGPDFISLFAIKNNLNQFVINLHDGIFVSQSTMSSEFNDTSMNSKIKQTIFTINLKDRVNVSQIDSDTINKIDLIKNELNIWT